MGFFSQFVLLFLVICSAILFFSMINSSMTNSNHETMHTTKQYFPINFHAAILSLLALFDFASVTSHMTWVYV